MAISGLAKAASSGGYQSIDDLIRARTPQAVDILNQGANEQIGFIRQGVNQALEPLQRADDMRAFEEQQAILGFSGQDAQEAAIGNIPVSQFDEQLRKRQQMQLRRGAAARGEAGGGATFEASAQLAGAQQANLIQKRLSELSPLVSASRNIRSDISKIQEQGRLNEAQVQSGLGTQLSNIRLGAAAPQIQSVQNEAELSGLQRISSANRQAQNIGSLASLAGSFLG